MQVLYTRVPVRRGASRRRQKLRRVLRRLRYGAAILALVTAIAACGSLALQAARLLGDEGVAMDLHELFGTLPLGGTAPAVEGENDLLAPQASADGGVHLAVGSLLQQPELKNGCEATSLAMALTFLGYPADKCDLAYGYIPRESLTEAGETLYGPWPGDAYPGDPGQSRGFYCYAAPLAAGGNAFLAGQGAAETLRDATGASLESLKAQLDAGRPVVVWVTLDYGAQLEYLDFSWQLPDGRTYIPYANLHCVVLCGYGPDGYDVCDPLLGSLVVEENTLAASYEAMGGRAVVFG